MLYGGRYGSSWCKFLAEIQRLRGDVGLAERGSFLGLRTTCGENEEQAYDRKDATNGHQSERFYR